MGIAVQFMFLTDSTFLCIQPRNHNEETLLYMEQREGVRKLKAMMKRKIQTQISCYWKGQEQRKVQFFSHICGNESSGCWYVSKYVTENCDFWYKAE